LNRQATPHSGQTEALTPQFPPLISFGFNRSVTGVGWDPANAAKTALGRNAASAVKKAVQVKIPDSFLPNEAPPDVHQPHGDDSHDVGQDYLHDSPDDPKLDNDNAQYVPTRSRPAAPALD